MVLCLYTGHNSVYCALYFIDTIGGPSNTLNVGVNRHVLIELNTKVPSSCVGDQVNANQQSYIYRKCVTKVSGPSMRMSVS